MNFLKIKLLVIAVIMFAASSAFASFSYNVSVDTSSLTGINPDGYLYFSYIPVNGAESTATISNFVTDGLLVPAPSTNVVDGSAVSGQLPGSVVFSNTNGINDYNHGIHFGNTFSFLLSFSDPASSLPAGGSSTFSLGLYSDEAGLTSLVTTNGTLFTLDLNNNSTTNVQTLTNLASLTSTPVATPIPAAFWLLGSGLAGLVGIRRRS